MTTKSKSEDKDAAQDWKRKGKTIYVDDATKGKGWRGVATAYSEGHAERIVASVNACADLSVEALEGGVVAELVEACQLALELRGLENFILAKKGLQPHEMQAYRDRAADIERKIRAALAKAGRG